MGAKSGIMGHRSEIRGKKRDDGCKSGIMV